MKMTTFKRLVFVASIWFLGAVVATTQAGVFFQEDFSADLAQWNTKHFTPYTLAIISSDGNPAPCLVLDQAYTISKQTFIYVGKATDFSVDLKQGGATNAGQRNASFYLSKTNVYGGYFAYMRLYGSTHSSHPNSLVCSLNYLDSGGNEKSEVTTYLPIPNGDGWHNAIIRIKTDGKCEFFLDHQLVYAGVHSITPAYDGRAAVMMGDWRSLYDNVLVEDAAEVQPVAPPTFDPQEGTFPGPIDVTISCATEGASIRYTTDGSLPSSTQGTVYTVPIHLNETTALNAIAFKEGMPDSEVVTANFILPRPVEINLNPGSEDNQINLNSKGLVTIAVLTREGFDATTIDPATVRFAEAPVAVRGAKAHLMASIEDVDGDGNLDLVLHFQVQDLQLESGVTQAVLTGQTYSGEQVRGSGIVSVVSPTSTAGGKNAAKEVSLLKEDDLGVSAPVPCTPVGIILLGCILMAGGMLTRMEV